MLGLSFTATPWPKTKWGNKLTVHRGDTVKISCNTSDPLANVTFTVGREPSKKATYFGGRLQQNGQTFHIKDVAIAESGRVVCTAWKGDISIQLIKGNLHVLSGK